MNVQTMVPRMRGVFNARPAYRPDIDGLRAVAVGMVLIYHAFPTWLPAGLLGVDVFFVISGYLITQLVSVALHAGTFSLLEFYRRRVRRIVPALLLTLGMCAAFGWFVLTPVELENLGGAIRWSAPFLANSYFANSTGYFQVAASSSPLLHLWSLGVEEQFYLCWPVLLIAAVRQGVTAPVLRAIIAVSLAISIWGAWDSPDAHFFKLACRIWELAAGGLLALRVAATPDVKHPPGVRLTAERRWASAASVAGLLLIIGSALLLNAERAFPGAWAVVPVVGTVLLIGAGPGAWINARILASRPWVFVGLISYSLYLWHWPLLVFTRILLGHAPPPGTAAVVLAGAFALACATYYLVECPIRLRSRTSRAPALLLAGLAAAGLFGVAFDSRWIGARLRGPAFLAFDAASQDLGYPGQVNFRRQGAFASWQIPSQRAQKVLFVGDSHVQQYWPRVAYVIGSQPAGAQSAEFATYSGCPPLPGVNVRVRDVSCPRFFEYALGRAWRPDVSTVVFGAYWESYLLGKFGTRHSARHIYSVTDPLRRDLQLDSPAMQSSFEEFARQLSRLVAGGRRVIIILSNHTSPRFDPLTLIPARVRLSWRPPAHFEVEPASRSVAAAPYEAFAAPVVQKLRAIAAAAGAEVIDPADTLCAALACATVTEQGTPLYVDSDHLRPFFARSSALFVDEMLLNDGAVPAPPGSNAMSALSK